MAAQGHHAAPAACPACARADPTRHFFCHNCISSCLADHNSRRQQLRNALTLVTAKANALLSGSDRPLSSSRAPPLGVTDERLLKADKWVLASRAYAAREAVVKAKQANAQVETDLATRRAALAARRANLSTARSLHSSLASSSPSTSSLSLPDSLPALVVRIENLSVALTALDSEMARVRGILKRELLAVVALAPLERPLADPFLSFPAPNRTLSSTSSTADSPSSSTATATPTRRPPSQSYTLSSLPLPPLSLLLSLPPPTLEALLSHLAHLVRLVALYDREALPFAPVMGLFGPGRPGVKAGPGRGVPAGRGGEGESVGGAGSSARRKSGLGTVVWPLVFGSRRRIRSVASSVLGAADGAGDGNVDADADDDDGDDYYHDTASSRSYARSSASSSTASAAVAGTTRSSISRRSARRAKLVLGGAVALALDFAFLAWARERRAGAGASGRWRVDDLDDLGALIRRSTGVLDGEGQGDEGSGRSGEQREEDDTQVFPLSMADALAHFTALALGPSSASTPLSRAGRSRAALEESGVVVEGEPELDGEDDEDEEWDLVSV
ncbi:hypothetical protein JCM3775_001412 [Rhodotorula graminis]